MADLERILEIVAEADRNKPPKELNRRFIIVEGLYQNTGMVCVCVCVCVCVHIYI